MPAVLYEKKGPITTITLNRPETRNRIDADIFVGLREAVLRFRDDPEVLVAIVTAAGEAFSDGAHHEKLLIPWADGSFKVPPTSREASRSGSLSSPQSTARPGAVESRLPLPATFESFPNGRLCNCRRPGGD